MGDDITSSSRKAISMLEGQMQICFTRRIQIKKTSLHKTEKKKEKIFCKRFKPINICCKLKLLSLPLHL